MLGVLFGPWEAKQSLNLKRQYAGCACAGLLKWSVHVCVEEFAHCI